MTNFSESTEWPQIFGHELISENFDAIVGAAINQGWKPAGHGNCSSVFVYGEQALKIFSDEAYSNYLTEIVKITPNPSFPNRGKLVEINDHLAVIAPATSKQGRSASFAVRDVRAAKVRRTERETRRAPKSK
jgi:hypothetical protein